LASAHRQRWKAAVEFIDHIGLRRFWPDGVPAYAFVLDPLIGARWRNA
jgi:hypothetical protein